MIRNDSQLPDARLTRLLGGDELSGLRQRLRRHFERHDGRLGSVLQLTNLSPIERNALALLLGRQPRRSRSMRVDIDQLDRSLHTAGIAESLRAALELLEGPIENRAALRQERLLRWAQVTRAERWHPMMQTWLATPAATSLLKRLSRSDPSVAEQLLEQASSVVSRLPAAGFTRAQLAAEALGNAHALDTGYPTATLVLAALKQQDRVAEIEKAQERVREIWARAGVLVNELARPVLCLNLPLADDAMITARSGEPFYLSLRTLLRTPPAWPVANTTIYLCENPNILSIAADRLGDRCAPLVCTEGMPAAAQRTLLTQLARAGARLLYHGDFDWPGLKIANFVMRTWPTLPWRFNAADYRAAVSSAPRALHTLSNLAIVASWDELLTAAMQSHGLAIAEEAVTAVLLEDLALRE